MATRQVKQQEYIFRVVALIRAERYSEAAAKLWPKYFQANKNTERLFSAFAAGHKYLLVMGHGSAGKTFAVMAYIIMRYLVAPHRLAATVTGATLTSLQSRAWADLKLLISNAAFALPLVVKESRKVVHSPVGKDELVDDKHLIQFVAAEHKDSQAKVQGHHAEETILVIEEADNRISESVWLAETNLATSGDFQRIALANPFERTSRFGQRCEPPGGWDTVDPDRDKEWDGKNGDRVVRLDGYDSPNYLAKRTVVPFLLSYEWFAETQRTKGEMSAEWWAYGRGFFPPTGLVGTIWPLEVINATLSRSASFYSAVRPIAALDPAFMEGGDKCVLLLGRLGRNVKDPRMPLLSADTWHYLKRRPGGGEATQDIASQVQTICEAAGVDPSDFIMDYTGNALGLGDVLATQWSSKINRLIFAGNATRMKLLAEDSRIAYHRFDRLVTELCFAAMEWGRTGCLVLPSPPAELRLQLEARLASTLERVIEDSKRTVKVAETKKDMKKRGYHSPDETDCLNLLVHLARLKERHGRLPATSTVMQEPLTIDVEDLNTLPRPLMTAGLMSKSKPTALPSYMQAILARPKRKSPLSGEPGYSDTLGTDYLEPKGE